MKLRNYQVNLSDKATKILKEYNIVALFMEVRTWKTITALETVKKYWAKNILFITKKKAIKWIKEDLTFYEQVFNITIINYESLHKIEWNFDLVILDESHTLSTFPKPNLNFKNIKKRFWNLPIILLSWTPSPESFSQLFHQFFVSNFWLWNNYTNFYKWAYKFVIPWEIVRWYDREKNQPITVRDYSKANYDLIMKDLWKLIITFTQKEANFTTKINENILYVKMQPRIYNMVKRLKKDKVIEWKKDVILADTAVKEMQKVHQLYSWTIKLESWDIAILDYTKWLFIKEKFKWKKIWIFYNFKAEKELLKWVFGENITDNLDEFNNTSKNIMLQIVSWREWISLKKAEYLVYYNISFSATSYWQSRDRLTTKERKENTIYWIFSEWWMEDEVYKSVQEKKKFTTKIYKQCEK